MKTHQPYEQPVKDAMTRPAESSSSQRARILRLLIEARGTEVPLPEIAECACQYGARIFELRRLGFVILNRIEEIDGSRRSWFRLVSGPPEASSPATPAAAPQLEREETLPLFPERNPR
jgi:hypothetical protein